MNWLLNIIYWLAYAFLCLTTVINAGLAMIGAHQWVSNEFDNLKITEKSIVEFNVHVIPITIIALVVLGVLR